MAKLNPYSTVLREQRQKETASGVKKTITKKQRRAFRNETRKELNKNYAKVHDSVEAARANYTRLMNETKL